LVKKDFPLDRAIMIAALLNSVQIGDEPQGSVFGHAASADKLAEPDQLAVDRAELGLEPGAWVRRRRTAS
jgi:hypothetical protein